MLVRRAGPERCVEAFRVDNPRPIFMVTRATKAGAAAILAEQSAAHSTRPLIDDTSGRFAGTLWRITTPNRIADTWSWPIRNRRPGLRQSHCALDRAGKTCPPVARSTRGGVYRQPNPHPWRRHGMLDIPLLADAIAGALVLVFCAAPNQSQVHWRAGA